MARTYKWVDTSLGSGSNNGADTDNAWQSIKTALEYNYHVADTMIIVSRRSSFASAAANIAPNAASDGTVKEWIHVIRFPLPEETFTATFTNGSTTVAPVSGVTPAWNQHVGRKIKNDADGKWYTITHVTGGNFIIDREFASATATGGNCTIEEDDFYDEVMAIDDSTWTVKLTDWAAHTKSAPIIDFEATAYYLYLTSNYMWAFYGINFKNGASDYGSIYMRNCSNLRFKACQYEQAQNHAVIGFNTTELRVFFDQCIFKGSESGSAQRGPNSDTGGGLAFFKNCAMYGFGDYGFSMTSFEVHMDNVNIGVEIANGDDDYVLGSFDAFWKDVKLGGTNGTFVNGIYFRSVVWSENHNKVLGDNRQYHNNGYNYTVPVVAGSGDPYKRTGGSDVVLAITENEADGSRGYVFKEMMHQPFGRQGLDIWVDTTSRTYRLYVQASAMSALAAEVFIEAEYIDAYDDTSEYHITTIRSDEAISVRSGADDWSQYIEVTLQSAVAQWAKLRLYVGFYDADGILYVNPLMVIS